MVVVTDAEPEPLVAPTLPTPLHDAVLPTTLLLPAVLLLFVDALLHSIKVVVVLVAVTA